MKNVQTVKYLTNIQLREAHKMLVEEFPDHAETGFGYYEWKRFAFIGHEIVGLITAQKYLPNKALVADIVVKKEYRSQGVGIILLRDLGEELLQDGYTQLMGFTPKHCTEALSTYKRVKTKQTEQIVTCSELSQSVPHIDRLLSRIKQARKKT